MATRWRSPVATERVAGYCLQAPDTEVHDARICWLCPPRTPDRWHAQHDVVASGQKGQQATCLLYIAKMALSQAGQGVQAFLRHFSSMSLAL